MLSILANQNVCLIFECDLKKQMEKEHTAKGTKISIENIIADIRKVRDSLATSLINDSFLLAFVEEHFDTFSLGSVKLEFIKRDLKELHNSSLDLAHYSTLIRQQRDSPKNEVVAEHPLFLQEMFTIFKKYNLEPAKK